jgi:protein MpaA
MNSSPPDNAPPRDGTVLGFQQGMQRLGKNLNRYCGDTIDISSVLSEIERAAAEHGWISETFFQTGGFKLLGLRRPARNGNAKIRRRIYLSAGIHGDEPAGPLAALQLLRENRWPDSLDLWFCPCLNPIGFTLNCRENGQGVDLNRGYLNPTVEEIVAHVKWLEQQPAFDLALLLHEDWESHGFYLYEQNPDQQASLAEAMIQAVAPVCPIDPNEIIEGRPAQKGIIRPNIDLKTRVDWAEAFYVITHKTRLSYTLEAPSDFPISNRVNALVTAVNAAIKQSGGLVGPESK